MTTFQPAPTKCALCGKLSAHFELTSSNEFGHPDLDTRPPKMYRSTMDKWIKRCPHCGYCWHDLSEALPEADEVVQGGSYKLQLEDSRFSELCNSFLCASMIREAAGQIRAAGWAALHAAWVMDDVQNIKASVECRLRAIHLFLLDFHEQKDIGEESGDYYALLVDLHRRAQKFDDAANLVSEGLQFKLDEHLRRILEFQQQLIVQRDVRCYTMAMRLQDDEPSAAAERRKIILNCVESWWKKNGTGITVYSIYQETRIDQMQVFAETRKLLADGRLREGEKEGMFETYIPGLQTELF